MVKQILIFTLFSSFQWVFINAQSVNQFDSNGLRHGTWQKFYEDSKQLRYKGTFDHGKEVGDFKFYDKKGGHPTVIKKYTSDSELIDVSYYTRSGTIISSGTMRDRLREGKWIYYHEDGELIMSTENYGNGKLEGIKSVFYEDGKKAQISNYKNNMLHGKDIHYNETGSILKELNYQDDKLEGVAKFYDYNGNLIKQGSYKNNRKHGIWKYFKNGKLLKEEKFPKNKIGITE